MQFIDSSKNWDLPNSSVVKDLVTKLWMTLRKSLVRIYNTEQTVPYSVLGSVWCLQALVHLIITTSYETHTLYWFIPNIKHYCIPGGVLGTEWYSSEHYEVTASMDNKK